MPQKDPMNLFYQTNLNQALQGAISDNGFSIPSQNTENIETLSVSASEEVATMLLDSTTGELKVIINGEIKTVAFT